MPLSPKPAPHEYNPGLRPSESIFTKNNHWLPIIDNNYDKTTDWGKSHNQHFNKTGKWMIRFPKGSDLVDSAWEKVKEGVSDGVFFEAKVATIKEQFDNQIIIIYTYDYEDIEDLVWMHNQIKERKIDEGALSQVLDYKTDHATRDGKYSRDAILYTSDTLPEIIKISDEITTDDVDIFWLKKAALYSIAPSMAVHSFFFAPKKDNTYPTYHPRDNLFLEVPYYLAATAIMLLTLPVDLFIALVALPVAAIHDLFVGIASCFPENDNEASDEWLLFH